MGVVNIITITCASEAGFGAVGSLISLLFFSISGQNDISRQPPGVSLRDQIR